MAEGSPEKSPKPPIFPHEILIHIASHIQDRATAATFSRVCRSAASMVERTLWEQLDLSIHPYHGYYPTVLSEDLGPHRWYMRDLGLSEEEYNLAARWVVDEDEDQQAEDRHASALRRKLWAMRESANERKWGMVRRVRTVLRPEAIHETVDVLEEVAPTVQSLDIEGPPQFIFADPRRAEEPDTFEVVLLDRDLHFPSLTHVRIGRDAIRFADFLPLLLSTARNVTSLDINFDQYLSPFNWDFDEEDEPEFPSYPKRTKIERLRLDLRFMSDDDVPSLDTVVELLERSRKLKQFSFRFTGNSDTAESRVEEAVRSCKHLQDLHWDDVHYMAFPRWHGDLDGQAGFSSVRRLVMSISEWTDMFETVRYLTNLEELYLILPSGDDGLISNDAESSPSPPPNLVMITPLVEQLRTCPKLCSIRFFPKSLDQGDLELFDRLDHLVDDSGQIRSMRHGDEEVFHASLFLDHFEVDDSPASEKRPAEIPGTYVLYTAFDQSRRCKMYEKRARAGLQHLTSYEGKAVPVEVLGKMGEVQGIGADWQGRGIEVGEEAWKVLEDWKAEV